MRRLIRFLPCLLAASVFACVTVAGAAADPPGIRWIAAPNVNSVDGDDVYAAYCAACHGPTGRGNGPAVKYLGTPVPDLTRICEREEHFSFAHVKFHIIERQSLQPTMADWKQVLRNNYTSDSFAELALNNLVNHIERLQVSHDPR